MVYLAILAFIVIFSLLILVHEWGHFTAARCFKVRVEEFGLGLPPLARKLFRDRKGTDYTLNWLPLGGFVRMKGEDTHDTKLLKAKDSFAAKKVWQRIVIVCAGVTMNLLSGFVLLVIVFSIGSTYLVPTPEAASLLGKKPEATLVSQEPLGVLVGDVLPGSPAAAVDLRKFDFVTTLDGQSFATAAEFQKLVTARKDQTVNLQITRRSYVFPLAVKVGTDGKLGIAISGPLTAVKLRYPFLAAVREAGQETWRLASAIVGALGGLFGNLLHGKLPADIGGPVAIAKETFYRASDLIALLNFAAMLSITLAIFNILPIPALDGGRLLFLIYEGISRRRPNPQMEAKIHLVGYVLLIGLILIISFKDIFG
jgi:regulator of sigma E protease